MLINTLLYVALLLTGAFIDHKLNLKDAITSQLTFIEHKALQLSTITLQGRNHHVPTLNVAQTTQQTAAITTRNESASACLVVNRPVNNSIESATGNTLPHQHNKSATVNTTNEEHGSATHKIRDHPKCIAAFSFNDSTPNETVTNQLKLIDTCQHPLIHKTFAPLINGSTFRKARPNNTAHNALNTAESSHRQRRISTAQHVRRTHKHRLHKSCIKHRPQSIARDHPRGRGLPKPGRRIRHSQPSININRDRTRPTYKHQPSKSSLSQNNKRSYFFSPFLLQYKSNLTFSPSSIDSLNI